MWDQYPYTNFHELNLDYFIVHFREIFAEWEQLRTTLIDWKDDTTEELEAWKSTVEEDLTERENALRAELEVWKSGTEEDISDWETATLAALDAWKTAAEASFAIIRNQAAASALAAAGSAAEASDYADYAEDAQTAAETAQAAAEDAAASIASSAAQIASNTAEIASVRAVLDSDSAGITTLLRPSNMIVPAECVDRAWIANDGTVSLNHAGYFCTGFIPVTAGETYKANSKGRNYGFYDSDKTFVSSGDASDWNSTGVTIPSGVAYVRYSVRKGETYDNIPDAWHAYFAVAADYNERFLLKMQSAYEADHAETSTAATSATTAANATALESQYVTETGFLAKYLKPTNLVNPAECVNNAYISTIDGSVSPNHSGYFCTGFIPVTAGTLYKANSKGRTYGIYRSDKSMLDTGNVTTFNTNGITIPEDGAYIRYTIRKGANYDNMQSFYQAYFAPAATFDDSSVKIKVASSVAADKAETVKSWLEGKSIIWFGDSIVHGRDFDDFVYATLDLVSRGDYGIDGSTCASYNGTDTRSPLCMRVAPQSESNPGGIVYDSDIVAVSIGTNDWMYAWTPIGTIADADDGTSDGTFYGALKHVCRTLIDNNPAKLIFFTTPIKRAQAFNDGDQKEGDPYGVTTTPLSENYYGLTLGEYADIIKEVCGFYSIPVLDLYRESLLNPSIPAQQSMFDGALTHPRDAARAIMARRICAWLNALGQPVITPPET